MRAHARDILASASPSGSVSPKIIKINCRVQHPRIAPCHSRTSQGATQQLRTLRHPHVTPCGIALSHPAAFAYRTLRLKNPVFCPKITPVSSRKSITQDCFAFSSLDKSNFPSNFPFGWKIRKLDLGYPPIRPHSRRSRYLSPKGHVTFPQKVRLPLCQMSGDLSLQGHATIPPTVALPFRACPHTVRSWHHALTRRKWQNRPIPAIARKHLTTGQVRSLEHESAHRIGRKETA